ncbi:MAG: tyrosine-type recombinase/integrase [Gammaproteobacteria bacterium]|nr:tyrosine-type recombinase/integrase [Gammaproteobacteria bacterium]MBU1716515.1 tyrosine-type recombinase/integrase [Pseudomonadota bacterium]
MEKHSQANERIKRQYLIFLKEARGQSEATIDAIAKALKRFEEHTKFRDFKSFHFEQARAFKRKLSEQNGQKSGERLSKSTLHATLNQLKSFFQWLSMQPGYKSKLQYPDAEYFNLSEKDTRVARARRPKRVPTLEQIKHVIDTMSSGNDIEQRDRALIAFTLLTGARDGAIVSMKLKHVDLIEGYVDQDAREVNTKFSKTFRTYFFPVGDEILEIVTDWIKYLTKEKLWGNDDPLFPATMVSQGSDKQFGPAGLDQRNWKTTEPIRRIFREAFERAGHPYFHPHSFRKTLASLAEKMCRTPEEFKAWSQNLGHENVLTTFTSYGEVQCQRQGEIIRDLAKPKESVETETYDIFKALMKDLKDRPRGSE